MDNEKILLIYKKLKEGLSAQEEGQLGQWLSQSENNKKTEAAIRRSWEMMSDFEPKFQVDAEADFEQLIRPKMPNVTRTDVTRTEVRAPQKTETQTPKVIHMKKRNHWWRMAAAIALLVGAALVFKMFQPPEVQMLTAQTQNDEIIEVKLADGSLVWLNENSRLTYPDRFDDERKVQLKGEAFFEVERNPEKTFRIETANTEVTVLGTSFNVDARPDASQTAVTVRTGKVKFAAKDQSAEVVLEKNEAATFGHADGNMVSEKQASPNAFAWQTKQLSFRNTPLEEVVSVLEDYFEISIDIENKKLKNCPYTMPRSKANLDAILENFKKLYGLTVDKKGTKEYLLKGGSC